MSLKQFKSSKFINAPEVVLRRFLVYLEYLKSIKNECVSSFQIAEYFKFTAIQVRKDIAFTGLNGRPKYGYKRIELIKKIEEFLGFNDAIDAFLIGAGNLGKSLASYNGFSKYSLNIVAIGDINPNLIGKKINGKMIFSIEKSMNLIKRLNIKLAIMAVPASSSQNVADMLVNAGVKAIWNFSSVRIKCPNDVIIQNEDLGASLSVLWQKLLVQSKTRRSYVIRKAK